MAVYFAARRPNQPSNEITRVVFGRHTFSSISGEQTLDVYPLVAGDLSGIMSAFFRNFAFQVDWAINTVITSQDQATMSAFPSNPTRRRYGNICVCSLDAVDHLLEINWRQQQHLAGSFIWSNIGGRLSSYNDVDEGAASFVNYIARPEIKNIGEFSPDNGRRCLPYADNIRTFFFPGVIADIYTTWTARAIHEVEVGFTNRIVAV